MPEPLFSVVIPSYNCAQYLPQAVESVLSQSLAAAKREIIVVDDGSVDETPAVVKRFGDAIRYLRKENGGVSTARNAGIAMARGEYVAFLDADDYWFPERLQMAQAMLERERDVFLVSDYFVERQGVREGASFYALPGRRALFELDAQAQMEFAIEDNFIHYMTIVPRKAFSQVGEYDTTLRYAEDLHLALRLLQAGYAVRLIETPCAVYRAARPGSATSRATYVMARDRMRVLQPYPEFVSPARLERSRGLYDHHGLREALTHRQLGMAMTHAAGLARNWGYLRGWINERFLHHT